MVSVDTKVGLKELRVSSIEIQSTSTSPSWHVPQKAYLAMGVALVVWSSAFAGIRAGLRAYAPAHLALFRYLIASTVLAIYARFAHFRRPAWRDIPALMVAGSLGITIYNLALNYGETRVTAGSASLLISSTPIWAALLAMLLLRERLTVLWMARAFCSFRGEPPSRQRRAAGSISPWLSLFWPLQSAEASTS
jgi:hypothetical protein